MFGPVGREVLSAGTIIFAIFATGSQLLAGQIALGALSSDKLCLMLYTGIFAIPTLLCSFPRTLDRLGWLSVPSVATFLVAALVGMIGAGFNPMPGRDISAFVTTDFVSAFISVTNPVFAYAGHFMFFILISEMKKPQDAMKAAWTLQISATSLYVVFAVVFYVYFGSGVSSPSFSSLPIKWQKAAYGLSLVNFLIAGSLYSHTSAKLVFVRIFRKSRHLHEHTVLGWAAWTVLIVIANGAAFVLVSFTQATKFHVCLQKCFVKAVGVPIFNYLVGIAASLFAAWFTYGIAGIFWLHDSWHDEDGPHAWRRHWFLFLINTATVAAGAFICLAGTYVSIKSIVDAYNTGQVPGAFSC